MTEKQKVGVAATVEAGGTVSDNEALAVALEVLLKIGMRSARDCVHTTAMLRKIAGVLGEYNETQGGDVDSFEKAVSQDMRHLDVRLMKVTAEA